MCFGAMNPALWNYDIQKNSGGRAAIVLLPLLMPDAILSNKGCREKTFVARKLHPLLLREVTIGW